VREPAIGEMAEAAVTLKARLERELGLCRLTDEVSRTLTHHTVGTLHTAPAWASMGSKRKTPLSGHLALSNSQPRKKRQAQLVEAGFCRECGSELGRVVTVCDKCADRAAAAERAAAAAEKQSRWSQRYRSGT
jgi:hypothetical protein